MDERRVFVIGHSLFAEAVTQTLTGSKTVTVVGTAATIEMALPLLKAKSPDAIIIADSPESATTTLTPLLNTYPDLPIFHTNLNTNRVQVITSHCIHARSSDLLVAIMALPKRRS